MKTILCTLLFVTLAAAAAKADDVTITFDNPAQTIEAGQTSEFFGTITNDTGSTIFLNSDDLPALLGLSLSTTDQFFSTVPISLAPSGQAGDSSGDIELFDVTASQPLLDAEGTYQGSYDLVGGIDGNAQDVLGSVDFSVTTVPEPSVISLFLVGLLMTLVPLWKKTRASERFS